MNECEQACIAEAVWSVSKCLFFHEKKIDSFNSMTSVFGNRITLVAHTHTPSKLELELERVSPLMRMPPILDSNRSPPIDATIYLFIFFPFYTFNWTTLTHRAASLAFDEKTYSMFDVCEHDAASSWGCFLSTSLSFHLSILFFYWQSFHHWMRLDGAFLLNILLLFFFLRRVCMRMIDRAKRNLGFIVKQ